MNISKYAKKKPPQPPSSSTPDFKSLSRETLEDILSDLYEKFNNVRNIIDLRMTGDSEPLVKKYKTLIENRLIEDIEEGTDGLFEALQAVRDFSGYGPVPRDQADIMLWFVETAVYCINDFGDLYEEFYDKADDLFLETLEFIKKHHLLNEFRDRCKKIVDDSEGLGYGFHDSVVDTYDTYFPTDKSRKKALMKKPVPKKPVKKAKPIKPRMI
ncbi:MAG: DUF6155 family protein [bacterium]